jgi:hypothetical protein
MHANPKTKTFAAIGVHSRLPSFFLLLAELAALDRIEASEVLVLDDPHRGLDVIDRQGLRCC